MPLNARVSCCLSMWKSDLAHGMSLEYYDSGFLYRCAGLQDFGWKRRKKKKFSNPLFGWKENWKNAILSQFPHLLNFLNQSCKQFVQFLISNSNCINNLPSNVSLWYPSTIRSTISFQFLTFTNNHITISHFSYKKSFLWEAWLHTFHSSMFTGQNFLYGYTKCTLHLFHSERTQLF